MGIHLEHRKIRRYFYFGSIAIILILTVLFTSLSTASINREYSNKIDQLTSSIIESKKLFMKNAVERTISLITNEQHFIDTCSIYTDSTQQFRDSVVQEKVAHHIRNLRLVNNGYIWVNQIENFEGGDKYAIRRIHPNLPETEGQWLSTNTTDREGNRPYEEELQGINDSGELYFEYYFKKMDSNIIVRKMSYAKLYPPFNWVIATGVYLDDVDALIQLETEKMHKSRSDQYVAASIIGIVTILLCIVVIIIIEKQISKMITSFESATKEYTDNLIAEKEKTQAALDEIVTLQGMLPICSNCKKIRDDNGYWEQVESYVAKHSQAEFSHSICPDCIDKLYGDSYQHEPDEE